MSFTLGLFSYVLIFWLCYKIVCLLSFILFGLQYRIPDAYDQEGGVDQEKRFSVAMQRYRLTLLTFTTIISYTFAHMHA